MSDEKIDLLLSVVAKNQIVILSYLKLLMQESPTAQQTLDHRRKTLLSILTSKDN